MRIRHFPNDSRSARYWQGTDVFDLCDDAGNVLLTKTGAELIRIIQAHEALVTTVSESAAAVLRTRVLYPKRRLLGQHKPLRGRDGLLAPQLASRVYRDVPRDIPHKPNRDPRGA